MIESRLEKLDKEIMNTVIEPYLEDQQPEDGKVNVMDAFTFERLEDCEYFSHLFKESLRVDPPAGTSSVFDIIKDDGCGPRTLLLAILMAPNR